MGSVPPTYLLSEFQFYGWSWKRVNNKPCMCEIFLQGHILSTPGQALRLLAPRTQSSPRTRNGIIPSYVFP
jgi:hypothetical protein